MWLDAGTVPSPVVLPGQLSTFPAQFCAVGRAAVIRTPADRGLSVHLLASPSASAAHSSVSGEPSVTPQCDQASLSHHSNPVLKWAEVKVLKKNPPLLFFFISPLVQSALLWCFMLMLPNWIYSRVGVFSFAAVVFKHVFLNTKQKNYKKILKMLGYDELTCHFFKASLL